MRSRIFTQAIKKIVFNDPRFAGDILRYNLRYYLTTNRYTVDRVKVLKPGRVNIMLSDRCNLRCRMCAQWGEQSDGSFGARKLGHIPLGLVEDILREVAPHRPMIYLWGGEPLLHPQFEEVLALIGRYRLSCLINTNGTRVARYAEALVEHSIAGVLISLLGDAETHDHIAQVEGSFDRILEGVDAVRRVQRRRGARRPFLQAHTIITEDNWGQVEAMMNRAETLGFDTLWLQTQCFVTQAQGEAYAEIMEREFGMTDRTWTGFVQQPDIDPEDLAGQIDRGLSRLRETVPLMLPSAHPDNLQTYLRSPDTPLREQACSILWNQIDILPNGDVAACHDFQDFVPGNVAKDGVLGVFNNGSYRALRERLRRRGPLPICHRCVGTLSV